MSNIDLYAINDTFISMNSSDINFCNSPYLLVGEDVDNEFIYDVAISYLYFDFVKLEKSLPIKQAELFLYINPHNYQGCSFEFPLEIYIISSNYDVSQVTWNTGSKIYSSGCSRTICEKNENSYIKIDVTNLCKNFIDKVCVNFGIALVGRSYDKQIYISSSKACNQPFIRIEFDDFNSQILESYNKPKSKLLSSPNIQNLDGSMEIIKLGAMPTSTCTGNIQSTIIPGCQGYNNIISKDINIPIDDALEKKAHSPYYIPFSSEEHDKCYASTSIPNNTLENITNFSSTLKEAYLSCTCNVNSSSAQEDNYTCKINAITGAIGIGSLTKGITISTGSIEK